MIRDLIWAAWHLWQDLHCVVCGRFARDRMVHPACLKRIL